MEENIQFNLHCHFRNFLKDLDKTLHIKGQMIFIQEWQLMLFLSCPIMKGLNNLVWSGLFINDLRWNNKKQRLKAQSRL